MAPFDDLPLPHVDPVTPASSVLRAQRVRAITLPPGVLPPLGERLAARQRRRKEGAEAAAPSVGSTEPEAPSIEVDPPETYSERGEVRYRQGASPEEELHLDLKA